MFCTRTKRKRVRESSGPDAALDGVTEPHKSMKRGNGLREMPYKRICIRQDAPLFNFVYVDQISKFLPLVDVCRNARISKLFNRVSWEMNHPSEVRVSVQECRSSRAFRAFFYLGNKPKEDEVFQYCSECTSIQKVCFEKMHQARSNMLMEKLTEMQIDICSMQVPRFYEDIVLTSLDIVHTVDVGYWLPDFLAAFEFNSVNTLLYDSEILNDLVSMFSLFPKMDTLIFAGMLPVELGSFPPGHNVKLMKCYVCDIYDIQFGLTQYVIPEGVEEIQLIEQEDICDLRDDLPSPISSQQNHLKKLLFSTQALKKMKLRCSISRVEDFDKKLLHRDGVDVIIT